MRNLLALFGLLVLGFAGIGWYMGWYKLSFTHNSDGNLEIRTNVDTKKVGTDSTDALKNLGAVIGKQAEKVGHDVNLNGPTTPPDSGVTPQGTPSNPSLPNIPNTPYMPIAPVTPASGTIPLIVPK